MTKADPCVGTAMLWKVKLRWLWWSVWMTFWYCTHSRKDGEMTQFILDKRSNAMKGPCRGELPFGLQHRTQQ